MPIITLSRGSKSGGEKLAKLLAEELGCYNLISREVLVKASEEYGITENNLNKAMSKPPKPWERSAGNPRLQYLTFIRAALLDFAADGCLIYHGNAGHFLLSDLNWVLNVRLIAPIERRIAMLMETKDIDKAQAVQYIHRVDEERFRWTKFLYNVDWSDPAHFDLVLNLQTMTLETACKTVAALAKSPEFIRTEQRESDLKNIALEAKVQATIESNPKTGGLEIQVLAKDGIIDLKGRVPDEEIRLKLIEVTGEIRGVSSVKAELVVV